MIYYVHKKYIDCKNIYFTQLKYDNIIKIEIKLEIFSFLSLVREILHKAWHLIWKYFA